MRRPRWLRGAAHLRSWWSIDRMALLVVWPCASACGDPPADRPAAYVNVRDSAGIQIVENGPLASVDTLGIMVDTAGRVRIGVMDGEAPYLFERIVAVTRMSDGRVAIGDYGSAEIRFFDQDGRFLSAAGGKGGGPGEYVNFYNFHPLPPDSLLIVDWEGGRWHFAGSDGVPGWRREAPRYPSTTGTYAPRHRLRGTYGDGTLLVARGVPSGCPPMVSGESTFCTDSVRTLRMHRDGQVLADFGVSAASTWFRWQPPGGGAGMILTDLWGQGHVAVAGMRTYVGHGAELTFQVFGSGGRLERIIRIAEPARPMPESWPVLSYADEDERRRAEHWLEARRAAPAPDHYPMFNDLVVGRGGEELWIRLTDHETHGPAPGLRWAVVDSAGVLRHVVRTPSYWPRFSTLSTPTFEVGRDYLLLVARDSFQVPAVEVYPLQRREPELRPPGW